MAERDIKMGTEKKIINPGRTQRSCQECGKPFYGAKDCFYCPECAKDKKSGTAIRIRTCHDCGMEFPGGPRARRCPECAYKARQEREKGYRKNGTRRPLGSIDKCTICGRDYTVTSGRQKYCPDCSREGVLAWQREHKKRLRQGVRAGYKKDGAARPSPEGMRILHEGVYE